MARLLACIALIVACALVCVYADEGLYSDRFDNIDVQAVFANEKLRRQYSGCLLGTGPCNTAPQRFLKGTSLTIYLCAIVTRTDFNISMQSFIPNLRSILASPIRTDSTETNEHIAKGESSLIIDH